MNELSTTRNEYAPPEPFNFRYDVHQVARIEREAEQLRAETVARQMAIAGRAIWRGVKWTAGALPASFAMMAQASAARETYETLSRLTDRQLEDIGLTRDGIRERVMEVLGGTNKSSQAAVAAELYAVKGGKSAKPKKQEAPRQRAA